MSLELGGGQSLKNAKGVQGQSWQKSETALEQKTGCPLTYTGYKKYHRMKFQAITLLNGLISHLSGLYHTPQNHAGVLAASHLVDTLAKYAIQQGLQEGDPPLQCYFQVYADPTYSISPHILSPFVCVGELMPEETQ